MLALTGPSGTGQSHPPAPPDGAKYAFHMALKIPAAIGGSTVRSVYDLAFTDTGEIAFIGVSDNRFRTRAHPGPQAFLIMPFPDGAAPASAMQVSFRSNGPDRPADATAGIYTLKEKMASLGARLAGGTVGFLSSPAANGKEIAYCLEIRYGATPAYRPASVQCFAGASPVALSRGMSADRRLALYSSRLFFTDQPMKAPGANDAARGQTFSVSRSGNVAYVRRQASGGKTRDFIFVSGERIAEIPVPEGAVAAQVRTLVNDTGDVVYLADLTAPMNRSGGGLLGVGAQTRAAITNPAFRLAGFSNAGQVLTLGAYAAHQGGGPPPAPQESLFVDGREVFRPRRVTVTDYGKAVNVHHAGVPAVAGCGAIDRVLYPVLNNRGQIAFVAGSDERAEDVCIVIGTPVKP